ncbi:MAG: hypothetical protein UR19_C0010G0008 [Candidatus Nomurabacteria bacterium GW2011_GWF1_31_48]|uniref:Uncharacterized protein n=1 Tax=Candidatus Nomurabacteria bacterium GW2011_GWF1_31_48 TaxID=1618767 RepID=A0A0F9YTA2_9BACT|nr:MAG: hypothetical protein UR19_C0010G0008 [Candidatus Nomurabacteria bacterium GW2011_GWF1_31_48]
MNWPRRLLLVALMVNPLERISTRTLSMILPSGVRVRPTSVLGVVGVKGIGRLVVGAGA